MTWMKLLTVAVLLGLAAADQHCDIDEEGISKGRSYDMVMQKFKPCITSAVTEEMINRVREAKSLGEFREFAKEFCPKASEVVTCMAGVRETLLSCANRNVSVPFAILSDLLEHLLPGLCENEGERLGYYGHGMHLMMKKKDTLIPLRHCLFKVSTLLRVVDKAEVDLTSETYGFYKEMPKFRKCMKYVEDEAYKPTMEWLMEEILKTFKCQQPEGEALVPCGEIDVTKVPVASVCDMKPLNVPNLYDDLEEKVMECHAHVISHDKRDNTEYTDLAWLKAEYKEACLTEKNMPACKLEKSAFAEACLSPDEDKQFQLFVRSVKDFNERSCVEEGAKMAEIMHEVYGQTAEHGHALRDCHKKVMDERASHHEHAVSTKNMRFYHEMIAYKQCVVEKLHANNDLSKDMETMINDVLRKMKCVKPEDGSVVLCETIHEH